MSISDQLRAAIENSPETFYRIAKEADVDWGTLQRFVDRSRPSIRIETVDKLCAYLKLELGVSREGKRQRPTASRSKKSER
jgi:hypothetical protein